MNKGEAIDLKDLTGALGIMLTNSDLTGIPKSEIEWIHQKPKEAGQHLRAFFANGCRMTHQVLLRYILGGMYDSVSDDFVGTDWVINRGCETLPCGSSLIQKAGWLEFGQKVTLRGVLLRMGKDGCRPANHLELLRYREASEKGLDWCQYSHGVERSSIALGSFGTVYARITSTQCVAAVRGFVERSGRALSALEQMPVRQQDLFEEGDRFLMFPCE